MASLGDNNDFASFLELDLDLDIDYSHLQINSHQNQQAAAHHQQESNGHNDNLQQTPAMFDFAMPMDLQFGMHQQNGHQISHHQAMVPPTPNSVEMHGENTAQYLQQFEAHRVLMQQYQMKNSEAQSLTPLVSPSVSVHDTHYDMSGGFTVPGAYFSPLTSPALEGQQYPYQSTTSSSIATASPIDREVEMQEANTLKPQPAKARKRPGPAPRSNTVIPRVKNSPATKAQSKRKSTASSLAVTDATGMRYIPSPNIPASAYSNESVSPEPLSESMGPPLKPASATHSPAITAKGSRGSDPYPVTPASLFKSQLPVNGRAQHRRGQSKPDGRLPQLTPLALPEAAAPENDIEMDDDGMSSRKTPKLGPLSTPSGSVTPQAGFAMTPISTISSPMSSNFPALKKTESKTRLTKKRGSVSTSILVSPALRPRISPSIKPLLPEGSVSQDDAHTAFLASRSNYQNLIEGTHVPGVSYPTELSTNLTSKRTSHKIAEQGRRNRINLALQEMLRLLPRSSSERSGEEGQSPMDDDDGSGSGKKGDANTKESKANSNSKAATVESAIEYIKSLKKEHEDIARVAAEKDKECEALKERLKAMERICEEKGLTPDGGSSSD